MLLALGAFTDFLDGYLARRWHQETFLGKILDPIADKLFTLTFLTLLMYMGHFPPLIWLMLFSRDLLIVTGALLLIQGGLTSQIKPNLSGKVHTVLEMITLLWTVYLLWKYARSGMDSYYIFSWREIKVSWSLYAGLIFTTLWSSGSYLHSFYRIKQ
jgi:CDP-diacylglycerol--glycerol-3-phosphate 3-phosphatidyltransferase